MHLIYVMTNKRTKEKYVGETSKTLEERFKTHKHCAKYRCDKYRLYKDMLEDEFEIELLEKFDYKEKKEIYDKEEYWINKLDTYNNGYNNAPRQNITSLGFEFTNERKKEYSEKFKGSNNPMYGKNVKDYMSEEKIRQWKENLSKARKGKKFTKEHKQKLKENNKKRKKVVKIDNGKETIYESLTIASKENKISAGALCNRIKKNIERDGVVYRYAE